MDTLFDCISFKTDDIQKLYNYLLDEAACAAENKKTDNWCIIPVIA
jgi:hypothetical protein